MGIVTGQWRARIGSGIEVHNVDGIGFSVAATFIALLLAVLLVIGGIELNPGPNSQERCEVFGTDFLTLESRVLRIEQREAAFLAREKEVAQREALVDIREKAVAQREALVGIREKEVAQREALVDIRDKEVAQREALVDIKEKQFALQEQALSEREVQLARKQNSPADVNTINSLLEKGVLSRDKQPQLLQWAVESGQFSMLRFLVHEARLDVDAKDSSGRSALFLAVQHGLLAAVRVLLPASKDMVVQNKAGELAFHEAASVGHVDVVNWLVQDHSGFVRLKDNRGRTALHRAAESGQLAVVQLLVHDAQADVEVQDSAGCTALHWAAMEGHLDVVKFLVCQAHANVHVKDSWGQTASDVAGSAKVKSFLQKL